MKLLILSDNGVPTGYGRIADEVCMRLVKRGHAVFAASLAYDGLLPPTYDGQPLPYHVAPLQGKPWGEAFLSILAAVQPDIILSIQDFPYHQTLYNAPVDWSRYGRVLITPVDGAPVHPDWLRTLGEADGALTISQFGVDTFRKAGFEVKLCRPGVNLDKFFRLPTEQRQAARVKLGISDHAFVLGTMAQNQGRKAINVMLRGFFEFALDKPEARYLLDMDAVSPAGWDIPSLCKQFGWDVRKLIFRADCLKVGLTNLNERYNLLDAHAVLAYREGYGLPLAEAMACGVVSIAQEWCSGHEVVGDGKGVEIRSLDYFQPSTWGGALDKLPDQAHFIDRLQWLYEHPAERAALAERGMVWARQQTWDAATDAVMDVLQKVYETRMKPPIVPSVTSAIIEHKPSPDGIVKTVELIEAKG